jgi:hypothetical protein|tara:strand:+ start:990 stop:1436 length:447 start_codon:yes stop_codon:yes gene_type:complete
MARGLTPPSARLLPSTPTFPGATHGKKKSLDATLDVKEARALENMQLAVDMHESFERVSLCLHASSMPHAAIYKIIQSILEVGDVEAFDTSPLELQNAGSKRTARSTSATNHTKIPEGMSQRGPRKKLGGRRGSIKSQKEQQRQQAPP